jgi:hypothetical protein
MLRNEKLYFFLLELIILFIMLMIYDLDYVFFFVDIPFVHIYTRLFIYISALYLKGVIYIVII